MKKKRANFKNGKDYRKSVKPAQKGVCAECQYKIYEASVDKVKVKEKDVFDKGTTRTPSQTQRSKVKSQRPNRNPKNQSRKK